MNPLRMVMLTLLMFSFWFATTSACTKGCKNVPPADAWKPSSTSCWGYLNTQGVYNTAGIYSPSVNAGFAEKTGGPNNIKYTFTMCKDDCDAAFFPYPMSAQRGVKTKDAPTEVPEKICKTTP